MIQILPFQWEAILRVNSVDSLIEEINVVDSKALAVCYFQLIFIPHFKVPNE